MKKWFLLFVLLTVLTPSQFLILAQQNKIDSLLRVLKTSEKDTSSINVLNLLILQYINTGSYEEATLLSQQAIQQSETLHYQKGIADVYNIFWILIFFPR